MSEVIIRDVMAGITNPIPVTISSTVAATTGDAFQFTVATGTIAANLGLAGSAGASGPCSEIEVACDIDSPGALLIGFATGNLTTTGFKLPQGVSVKIKISNSNKIWVGALVNASKGSAIAT